jgi:TolA-binding protein
MTGISVLIAASLVSQAAPAGPTVTLQQFLSVRGDKIHQITDSQIVKMRALVRMTADDDPAKPDYLFRLAELCAENQRFYFARAHALDQRIFDAPAAGKPPLLEEQRRHAADEQAWLLESVKAYVAATRYPRYERMDEVLFRLAHVLASVKKEDEARGFLLRLVKDHPSSKYIPDAYLAFAELYFDRGDMEGALRFYDKVAEFPSSSVYPYAVYKKGWCHMNRGDFKAALETFVAVARLPRAEKPDLTREARKDIVRAYAHVGGPDKAWEFFRRTGGDGAGKMMEALAERYWEQGQAADSTRVYRKIIADNAASARLCEWQVKIVRNTRSAGDKRAQTQELERLAAVFERARPPAAGDAHARGLGLECRNAFHDSAREAALVWHREAQKTRNADTYALAERVYRLYLAHFPDGADAADMRYYHGEILWALERWKEAAEEYGRVVETKPDGPHARDAAYAAVLAWKNLLAFDEAAHRDPPARPSGDGRPARLAPEPISENERKMIAAFHVYRARVPDAPELPVIIYREAYIDYDHNRFDDAEPLFLEVVQKYPAHELAAFAANLFLDALNAQGKTAELVTWVGRFLDTKELVTDATLATRLVSLLSDAHDLEGHEHERRGDPKECARSFLAAADALPAHAKHAERLWNAGQCFQNAHLTGQAVKAWQALIKAHPDDTLAKKAIFRVAAGYHQLAIYEKAAEGYETFARRFPGEPQAAAALGNATAFREGLGQLTEAAADMDAFVAFYGRRQPQDAAAVDFQKGELLERQGKLGDLAAHLRGYLATWSARGGLDRQVEAHFRLGELAWQASCARAGEDGACLHVERVASSRSTQIVFRARRRLGRDRRAQCGPVTKSKIVVLDRNRAQAAAAAEHFHAAIKLWAAGDAANPIAGRDAEARRAAAAHAAAGAAFYLAEADYEALLRLAFPRGLDFSAPAPRDSPRRQAATARKLADSQKRLGAYLGEKARLLEKARAEYLDVFRLRQAHWTIAAAARIGELHQDFAGQLYTAEIPSDLPDTDAWGNHPRDLYCTELEDRASKIEDQAVGAFESCLTAATRESWYNEWSRLCERELNQLEPVQFPLSAEIKPEAGQAPTVMSAARVISSLN